MSEPEGEDEETFCFFGTSLDPYDEDTFPKKKPITVEEQVARDAQGRRRFHGAFTGGFSAGFFNTVGSLEGWAPQEFKSSRSEKASHKAQRPEDYMDDEDVGEFGIAPQAVRATEEFANKKKRKKQVFSNGPIPGEPVLQTLLESGNETVGYLLLRNMGLKHSDEREDDVEEVSGVKVYGCEMPRVAEIKKPYDCAQYSVPEIYKEFLSGPKSNTNGLGHESLQQSHINLFQTTNLVVKERNNKKLSIAGQAFGVGAFEDEDEDIYVKENMNRYDFELTSEKATTSKAQPKNDENTVMGTFSKSKNTYACADYFPPPTIPQTFSGKHNVRKSRFEPLPDENRTVERKHINADIRARYLGEEVPVVPKPVIVKQETVVEDRQPQRTDTLGGFSGILLDRFVSAGNESSESILEPVARTETEHGTQEMRDAAKMKMFGPLTRVSADWQPCALLCKRFNVPEPFGDNAPKTRKRTKHLIFEYQKEEDSQVLQPGLSKQKPEPDVVSESVITTETIEVDNSGPSASAETVETPKMDTETVKQEPEEKSAPIDVMGKIDVSKNVDLFKAVFLSSSESEGEEEEENKAEMEDRSSELKKNVLEERLIPKIKPTKPGILSNVNFDDFKSGLQKDIIEEEKQQNSKEVKTVEVVDASTYGPKLPETGTNKTDVSVSVENDDDEWVEKDGIEKKKHKHKKNKKEKYEHHKKHKHKKKRDR